ncbi:MULTISPECIES: SH3 domain-containing protein [Amycolatopsis]|uniref:SH3b domain-containing protein n=1 Tax=Amycolatopsis thermoflava TaxID=84480 RepID=A0A3N2H123_9PSEU|nr:hypothetical protein [Amycolatopsis thermoflava]ROS42618.1 hypothetical protein EDD35_5010 [Amycolatopsis thermoflava]
MLKRSVAALAGLAIAAGSVLVTAPAANATPSCRVGVVKETVKIRSGAGTNYTALGQVSKGAEICTWGTTSGGSYSACGSSSSTWVIVHYSGRNAYIARTCVSL